MLEAAKLLHPTLGEHIEITPLLAEDAWTALADPNQLTTAVLNLAINARDAMPNGGKLALETSNVFLDESYASMHSEVTPGNYVMIAVSDTGSGIPPALLERVFEPFFTTKEVGRGTWPWPQHGVRLRQAVRRSSQDLQRGRPRHVRQDLPAAGDGTAADRRGSAGLVEHRGRQRNRSSSSRTIRWCGAMS